MTKHINSYMSKSNVILAIFLVIAIVYLVWAVYAAYFKGSAFSRNEEHFTDGKLTDYEARMAVMKVFDTVLHRKPLPDEIDKYAKVTNEQDMLIAVMTDYNITTPPPPPTAAATASEDTASASASVPAVVTSATTATAVTGPLTTAPTTPAHVVPATHAIQAIPVPAKTEAFDQSTNKKSNANANANGAASPSSNPSIDLKSVETNLSTIVDTVNSIRALLYTQTMCEQ